MEEQTNKTWLEREIEIWTQPDHYLDWILFTILFAVAFPLSEAHDVYIVKEHLIIKTILLDAFCR